MQDIWCNIVLMQDVVMIATDYNYMNLRISSSSTSEIYNYKHGHDKATKRIRSKAETKSQEPQYHLTNVCAMSQHCRYCSLHQPRLCEPTCKMIANPPQPQASDEGVVAMILDTYYKVCIEYIPG